MKKWVEPSGVNIQKTKPSKLSIQKMASSSITSWQVDVEKVEIVTDFVFLGSKITAESDCRHKMKRHLLLGRKAATNIDSILKSRDTPLLTKVCIVKAKSYGFSSIHVWMWELDHKESWVRKNWCFPIVLEKTFKSPLDIKKIKPVSPKGNQPWIFIGRTVSDAEAPILWPPDGKSWLTEKDPMLEKVEDRRRRGNRGWDSWWHYWLQWTWIKANSERQ